MRTALPRRRPVWLSLTAWLVFASLTIACGFNFDRFEPSGADASGAPGYDAGLGADGTTISMDSTTGTDAIEVADGSDAGGTDSTLDGGAIPDAGPVDAGTGDGDAAAICSPACPMEAMCVEGGVCSFDCTQAGACAARVVCPAGAPCQVSCGSNGCTGGVDCRDASSCSIDCTGTTSCKGPIACGGTGCTINCAGTNSCSNTIACDGPGSCHISCGNTSSCAGSITSQAAQTTACCSGVNACSGSIGCGGATCAVICSGLSACAAGVRCDAGSCNSDAAVCP